MVEILKFSTPLIIQTFVWPVFASIICAILFYFQVVNVTEKIVSVKNKNNKYLDRPYSKKNYQLTFMAIGFLVTFFALTKIGGMKSVFLVIFTFIACVGTLVDNRIHIIANEMVLLLLALGVVYQFLMNGFMGIVYGVISMAVVFVLFMITLKLTKGFSTTGSKIGAGDLKLKMAVALITGYPDVLTAFTAMSVSMVAYVLVGLSTRMMSMKSTFPMAVFIMIGLVAGLFNGVLI